MTKRQGKSGTIDVKALLAEDEEFLRALVRTALQEVLEAEMTEALGAEKGRAGLDRSKSSDIHEEVRFATNSVLEWAVTSELVSVSNSLLAGKIQGISSIRSSVARQ